MQSNITREISRTVQEMARAAAAKAEALAAYANALAEDPSLQYRLADLYAAGPAVVQIMGEVDRLVEPPNSDPFRRALTSALVTAQSKAGA